MNNLRIRNKSEAQPVLKILRKSQGRSSVGQCLPGKGEFVSSIPQTKQMKDIKEVTQDKISAFGLPCKLTSSSVIWGTKGEKDLTF